MCYWCCLKEGSMQLSSEAIKSKNHLNETKKNSCVKKIIEPTSKLSESLIRTTMGGTDSS